MKFFKDVEKVINIDSMIIMGPVEYANSLRGILDEINKKTFKFTHQLEFCSEEEELSTMKEFREHLKKRRRYKEELKFITEHFDDIHKAIKLHHIIEKRIKSHGAEYDKDRK